MIARFFGAARAFLSPAAPALTPMLVPRADRPQAISLKSLSWQGAVIVGPWFGGLLVALSPATACRATAFLYAAGIAIIVLMRVNSTPDALPGHAFAGTGEGLAYVRHNRIILGAISPDLFAMVPGGATALLPAFASGILNIGPQGFGLLRSGPAVGAAVSGGVGTVGVPGLWAWMFPELRRADRLDGDEPKDAAP